MQVQARDFDREGRRRRKRHLPRFRDWSSSSKNWVKIWTFTNASETTWLVWFCKCLEEIVTFRDLNRHAIDGVLHLLVPAAATCRFRSKAVEVQMMYATFDVEHRLCRFPHHLSRRDCHHQRPTNRLVTRRKLTAYHLHRNLHLRRTQPHSLEVDPCRHRWGAALFLHLKDHRPRSCKLLLRLDRGILTRTADLEVMALHQAETVVERRKILETLATARRRMDTATH